MKILLTCIIFSSYLFSINGKLIFNDGTTIQGKINIITMDAVNLVPEGLTFPEEIRVENIDTLRLDDGNILIENSNVVYLYQNGEFIEPSSNDGNERIYEDDYELEYVLVPNWSINLYTGHPIIAASSFQEYNDWFFLNGFSVGSPYGLFAGDFFINAIFEFAHYTFKQKNNPDGQSFGGSALQLGISPGFPRFSKY